MSTMTSMGPNAYFEMGESNGGGIVYVNFFDGNGSKQRLIAVRDNNNVPFIEWLVASAAAFHKVPINKISVTNKNSKDES